MHAFHAYNFAFIWFFAILKLWFIQRRINYEQFFLYNGYLYSPRKITRLLFLLNFYHSSRQRLTDEIITPLTKFGLNVKLSLR